MADEKPIGFSTNFQREVQAMLYLHNWKCVSRKEIRMNLPKLGMELSDEELDVPTVPAILNQIPADDSYPYAEPEEEGGFNQIPEEVLKFIEDNKVPDELISQLPFEAFVSVGSLLQAINVYAAAHSEAQPESEN